MAEGLEKNGLAFGAEVLAFHCPRWSELPDLDLYMDQVVTFLDQSLAVFSEGEKPITATMINNYVKQRVVTPPVRKRYAREHVAYLMVVFLLKKVLSIPEIIQLISMQSHAYDTELAYNYFCEELERALRTTFWENDDFLISTASRTTYESETLRAAVLAFASKVYIQKSIAYVECTREDGAETPLAFPVENKDAREN
jgi:hypothetical protein